MFIRVAFLQFFTSPFPLFVAQTRLPRNWYVCRDAVFEQACQNRIQRSHFEHASRLFQPFSRLIPIYFLTSHFDLFAYLSRVVYCVVTVSSYSEASRRRTRPLCAIVCETESLMDAAFRRSSREQRHTSRWQPPPQPATWRLYWRTPEQYTY